MPSHRTASGAPGLRLAEAHYAPTTPLRQARRACSTSSTPSAIAAVSAPTSANQPPQAGMPHAWRLAYGWNLAVMHYDLYAARG